MSAIFITSGSGFASASLEEIVVTARKKAEGLQDVNMTPSHQPPKTFLSGEF